MPGESKMPTIKILRNGQLTLPAKFRKVLDLKEGDFLDVELGKDKIILKPVTVIEKNKIREMAGKRFFKLVEENWRRNKNLDQKKVETIVDEAVDEVRGEKMAKAKAGYIITGDLHLKKLESYKGIRIVTPAEFVRILQQQNS